MQKITFIPFLILGVFLLSGCSFSGGNSATSPAATSDSVSAPKSEALASASVVNIEGFAFNPATLTVKKGATVTWANSDSAPHQIKSVAFNSGLLNKGQSFSFTFNEAGTFDYICSVHPSMAGKIIAE